MPNLSHLSPKEIKQQKTETQLMLDSINLGVIAQSFS